METSFICISDFTKMYVNAKGVMVNSKFRNNIYHAVMSDEQYQQFLNKENKKPLSKDVMDNNISTAINNNINIGNSIGYLALNNTVTGQNNTAVGTQAFPLNNILIKDSIDSYYIDIDDLIDNFKLLSDWRNERIVEILK